MNKDFKYSQEIRYCPVCKKDELFVSVTDIPHLSYCNCCGVVCDTHTLQKSDKEVK